MLESSLIQFANNTKLRALADPEQGFGEMSEPSHSKQHMVRRGTAKIDRNKTSSVQCEAVPQSAVKQWTRLSREVMKPLSLEAVKICLEKIWSDGIAGSAFIIRLYRSL